MKAAVILSLLILAGCPVPGPVVPTPDASDAATGSMGLDADPYAACCAAMHDVAPECSSTLRRVVETHLTSVPAACAACGLACR